MPKGAKRPPGALQNAIAGELRAQIGRLQFSHQKIADAAGMSRSQLSDVVNGKKHIDVEDLDNVCWALGLDILDVLDKAAEATPGRFLDRPDLVPLV